jgi:hypothetical protein
MSIQSLFPFQNCYLYKNLLLLINNQSLRNTDILNYFKNTIRYLPNDNDARTIIFNSNELYYLNHLENIFILYSIDGKFYDTITLLNQMTDIICSMIKIKYKTPISANLSSVKLCCYLPYDKNVPLGFVKHSENNQVDLQGFKLLQSNLCLYVKVFKFNENFELIKINFM